MGKQKWTKKEEGGERSREKSKRPQREPGLDA